MNRRRFLALSVSGLISPTFLSLINTESFAQSGNRSICGPAPKTAQTITPFFYEQFLPKESSVKVFPFTNPGDQKTALLAVSLDITGTTIVHAITSAARGEPIVVVCSLCDKCSALVVKKERGSRRRPTCGKKIGYVPSTMHYACLRETLIKAGLDPAKDVTLLRIDFFDMGQALARGNIDAFLSGEPFPTQAVVQGYGEILAYPYYGDSIGPINAGMIVTRDLIVKKRDLVQAAVQAHSQATEYLIKHPDVWLKRAEESGTRPEILREAVKNMSLVWEAG